MEGEGEEVSFLLHTHLCTFPSLPLAAFKCLEGYFFLFSTYIEIRHSMDDDY